MRLNSTKSPLWVPLLLWAILCVPLVSLLPVHRAHRRVHNLTRTVRPDRFSVYVRRQACLTERTLVTNHRQRLFDKAQSPVGSAPRTIRREGTLTPSRHFIEYESGDADCFAGIAYVTSWSAVRTLQLQLHGQQADRWHPLQLSIGRSQIFS